MDHVEIPLDKRWSPPSFNYGSKNHYFDGTCWGMGKKALVSLCNHIVTQRQSQVKLGLRRPSKPCKMCMAELFMISLNGNCDIALDMLEEITKRQYLRSEKQ